MSLATSTYNQCLRVQTNTNRPPAHWGHWTFACIPAFETWRRHVAPYNYRPEKSYAQHIIVHIAVGLCRGYNLVLMTGGLGLIQQSQPPNYTSNAQSIFTFKEGGAMYVRLGKILCSGFNFLSLYVSSDHLHKTHQNGQFWPGARGMQRRLMLKFAERNFLESNSKMSTLLKLLKSLSNTTGIHPSNPEGFARCGSFDSLQGFQQWLHIGRKVDHW